MAHLIFPTYQKNNFSITGIEGKALLRVKNMLIIYATPRLKIEPLIIVAIRYLKRNPIIIVDH